MTIQEVTARFIDDTLKDELKVLIFEPRTDKKGKRFYSDIGDEHWCHWWILRCDDPLYFDEDLPRKQKNSLKKLTKVVHMVPEYWQFYCHRDKSLELTFTLSERFTKGS